ncbi:Coenzyme F420 hydrogenase/dehydrogenase, beta subunit C-terminal domain [Methanolobus sp. WCC1]|uniref:Coenzyme F420 hydrogenase/dehydrogenase, beta subunit C-terminal domain n=1 Tax=unclassified Methanolobus TaxID=2629569 RepID=UPI0032558A5E
MNGCESIVQVVSSDLCTGCGTCVSICPQEAIQMEIDKKKGIYIPKVNSVSCNNCNLCLNSCPGHSVDFKNLNYSIFEKKPENTLIGNYQQFYTGYSKNHDIRHDSSSGGVITQLLIFALEKGMINGALVTKMDKDNPLEPFPFIARTKEEIVKSMGSKYCPVPLNIGLKEILSAPEGEKFVVVGLPCHIHGLKKAAQINRKLADKILFTIGIICSKCPNFLATEYLLYKLKIPRSEVTGISYRGNGYPGSLEISLADGTNKFYDFWDYYDTCFGQFFAPTRCRLCIDFTSEFSDISCGDVFYDSEFEKDSLGSSVIISRNSFSEGFLKNAESYVGISPASVSRFVSGCTRNITFKKSDLIQKSKTLNCVIPDYNSYPLLKSTFYTNMFLYVYKVGNYLSCNKKYWFILKSYGSVIGLINLAFEKINKK